MTLSPKKFKNALARVAVEVEVGKVGVELRDSKELSVDQSLRG